VPVIFAFLRELESTPIRILNYKTYDSDRIDKLFAAQDGHIALNRLNRSQTMMVKPATLPTDRSTVESIIACPKTTVAFALVAAGDLLYPLHNNGRIFKFTGTRLIGWQELNNNPAS
jgi:hypothetical protein